MSKLSKLPVQDEQYDQASVWLARLDRGLSDEEKVNLGQWLSASTKHRELLMNMAGLWDRMDALTRLSEIFPHRPRQRPPLPWGGFALAASVLIVISAGAWTFLQLTPIASNRQVAASSVDQARNSYETAIGEHSTVNLQDGTQVTLNTNSLVRVQYSERERLIFLERGEIHVQVSHDENRPLSVVAGDNIVQAVGTAFNIEIDGDERIELVVTQGAVKVSVQRQHKPIQQVAAAIEPVSVSAGHSLVLGSPATQVHLIDTAEIEAKLAWREGKLIFRGERLGDAVKEVSRYAAVNFVFVDEASKNVRVAGRFKVGDIDDLLVALHQNFYIRNQRVDENTILLSSTSQ